MADNLASPGVCVLEVDEDTEAYWRGHIPNSCGVHWRDDLQDPLRREFVGADAFVLYGGNNNWFAAYAYWYFKYYGHDAVQLMNGGRKKWELEGRELVQEVPMCTPTAGYQARGPLPEIRALREQLLNEVLGDEVFRLVDVRSPEEYRGELLAPRTYPRSRLRSLATSPAPATSPGRVQSIPKPESFSPSIGCRHSTRLRE